ncbi:serine/threonine-protein kinase [Streptomyces zhihengii]
MLDGRYELTERLGRGGMGQVWSARDERMQREVAVKLVTAVPDAGDEETFHRFQREIRSAANLPGRHTVTAHDCGEAVIDDEPYLYMVMERLTGRTLAQEIRRARPPWRTAVRWGYQVASALHAAHTLRIVHRDIKPENVMFAADGDVKVLDFGIAKFLGDTARAGGFTRTGVPMGTLLYMSPEQARGDTAVDHRTDLYSLGCLLYFMLTGRPRWSPTTCSPWCTCTPRRTSPAPHAGAGDTVRAERPGDAAPPAAARGPPRDGGRGAGAAQGTGHRPPPRGTTLPILTGDRAGAEAEIAAKLAGAQEIYQASIRDARAREEEAEAALLAARGQADELRTRAADEAGAVRAEAERYRVDLRHRTEQEIVALRTRAERRPWTCARRPTPSSRRPGRRRRRRPPSSRPASPSAGSRPNATWPRSGSRRRSGSPSSNTARSSCRWRPNCCAPRPRSAPAAPCSPRSSRWRTSSRTATPGSPPPAPRRNAR